MSSNIDTRVTPALHPGNVKTIDGYDEETAHCVGATETAFSEAYEGVRLVHEARAAARTNPVWGEAQQLIETQKFADKVAHRVAKQFDRTLANLQTNIALIERELSVPVASAAGSLVAGEVRTFCRNLEDGKRIGFVRSLIIGGDSASASAILGGPAFLSGLTNESKDVLTRMFNETAQPALSKRLKVMKGAADLIGQHAGLLFAEMEKAVGAPTHKVAKLRAARDAAEQAFILRDNMIAG